MSGETGHGKRPRAPDWRPSEKVVQRQIVSLFSRLGGVVHSTSQYRMSGVTPGMADLYAIFPLVGKWAWFEVKKPKRSAEANPLNPRSWACEPLRPTQEVFRDNCLATGQPYYWGGYCEAEDMLIALGLATREPLGIKLYPRGIP